MARDRLVFVYVLASHARVLYVGTTSDLPRRLAQHRAAADPGAFTARYRAHRLVHFEAYRSGEDAVRRDRKVALVEAANPGWHDLLPTPCALRRGRR